MRLRSLLYVPAHLEKFIAKAHLRDADAIILDLEDSVPKEFKISARHALAINVKRVKQNGALVFIRINHQPNMLYDDIVAACQSYADGIIYPKLQNQNQLNEVTPYLVPIERTLNRPPLLIYALIEDPLGVLNALDIAQHERVIGLGLGSEDYCFSINAKADPDVLFFPKMQLHLAAKAAGKLSFGLLQSIAGFNDEEKYHAAVYEAKRFGFDGSTCVHPSSVRILNDGFDFTEEEILEAYEIVTLHEENNAKGLGAFMLNGKMIDQPHIERALSIVNRRV